MSTFNFNKSLASLNALKIGASQMRFLGFSFNGTVPTVSLFLISVLIINWSQTKLSSVMINYINLYPIAGKFFFECFMLHCFSRMEFPMKTTIYSMLNCIEQKVNCCFFKFTAVSWWSILAYKNMPLLNEECPKALCIIKNDKHLIEVFYLAMKKMLSDIANHNPLYQPYTHKMMQQGQYQQKWFALFSINYGKGFCQNVISLAEFLHHSY